MSSRSDMTFAVDWALKTNYLSIFKRKVNRSGARSRTWVLPLTSRAPALPPGQSCSPQLWPVAATSKWCILYIYILDRWEMVPRCFLCLPVPFLHLWLTSEATELYINRPGAGVSKDTLSLVSAETWKQGGIDGWPSDNYDGRNTYVIKPCHCDALTRDTSSRELKILHLPERWQFR